MILNSFDIRRFFLPLTLAAVALVAVIPKASAEEPDLSDATSVLSKPIARSEVSTSTIASTVKLVPSAQVLALAPESTVQATPEKAPQKVAPVPGRASTLASGLMARSTPLILAQSGGSSSSSPSSGSQPSSTTPSSSPGTVAPETTTPNTTNPTPVTPNSTTPGTTTPGTLTPGTTTPGTLTPETTTPVTPNSTTPGTLTPGTTPGTTTPGTTTPGTTTPETTPTTPQYTPGTTRPGTTTPTENQLVAPGRATRSGSSYVGIGGNIGLGSGDNGIGRTSFAILSKIGLTNSLSVRPSVLLRNNVTVLVPVTYDFGFGEDLTSGLGFSAAPYVGVGASIGTGGDSKVGLLLTGGVDVPINSNFTATAAVNATVTGETAVGILIGVGYNFAGF